MVYQWKISRFPVSAQEAGAELERIALQAPLTPENVVNESRSDSSILHSCFDWNDITAAESYREVQAREILRNIVTVNVGEDQLKEPVRAFVNIQNEYKPIDIVIKTKDYQDEMLQKALSELRNFQRKYSALAELGDLLANIKALIEES